MQRMILLVALILIGPGLFDAHAQSAGSSGLVPSATSPPADPATTGQAGAQAPIGHRQPRAADVPNQPGASPADAEIDRKLTICRDCR